MSERFDYIIIGAGSTGCVIAHRLAEVGAGRICVIEAGPRDLEPFIHIPAGFTKTIVNPKVNWMYKAHSGDRCGGRVIKQPRGKVLGGSGSINGNIFYRGQQNDFDMWAQRGNRGWAFKDVLPYFRRLETRIGHGDEGYRGDSGPLIVTDTDWHHPLVEAFIAAANGLGIPTQADYNGAFQSGVSYSQRTVYKGRRMSPARAFLRPAMAMGGVHVMTETLVDRLLLDGKRTTGVRVVRDGQTLDIHADNQIILSAGVFNSPQVLHRSGIGPGQVLSGIGVPVLAELPGVGENLRDHCYVGISARVENTDTINERSRGLPLVWEVTKFLVARRGLLTLQPSFAYLSWKSEPSVENDDICLAFAPASYDTTKLMALDTFPGMTCAAWQHRPHSSGWVRAVSTDPNEPPDIRMNFLEEAEDRRLIVAAAKLARSILKAPEFAPFYVSETTPGDDIQSDDEWTDFVCARADTSYHPVGTCRMGPTSDPTAVVDDHLKVHGIENLRIADASIMPDMVSANTNAASLMIGEKASDLILGRSL